MKRIKLTRGMEALIDNWNYKWLIQWNWHVVKCHNIYYAARNSSTNSKRQVIYMHREVLGLKQNDGKLTDHKNHNGLDNREHNIKIVTYQQNNFNKINTKGYYWSKQRKKWHAKIGLNGKSYYLDLFDNKEDAHKAYLKAKQEYHN